MASESRTRALLGCAGLLPFVIPALITVSGSDYSDTAATLAGVYAFGIIAFLTGSWWGLGISAGPGKLPWLSNLYFLLALACFLLLPRWWPLGSALLLFGMLLIERRSTSMPAFDSSYRGLRRNLTLVAAASMLTLQLAA